jgi:hypothetical protein
MKKFILLIIEKIRKSLKVDEKGNSFGWGKGTLLLAALIMVGCSNQNKIAKTVEKGDFATLEYDSCEYLLRVSGYQGYLAHKGNCRFCKERRQKEMKELIEQLKK